MSGQHTPGPWLWLGTEGTIAMIVDEDGYSIARVTVTENSTAHHALQANLRLMTASPDLLDALLDALPYVEDVLSDPEQLACFKPGVVERHASAIRAAIERATGGQ